jgi:DNA-binding CsgD family transcriptional regulator
VPTSKQRRGFERARREIAEVCGRGHNRVRLLPRVAEVLQEALPFDGGCWHTADPSSLLITSHWTNLSGDGFAAICSNEYASDDVNKFASLAGRRVPASSMRAATKGHPETSARFRDVFQPNGWADELRVSFDSAGMTWGSAMLLRAAGAAAFSPEETAFAASVGRVIADGLRNSLVVDAATSGTPSHPCVLVFDPTGALEQTSAGTDALLAELGAGEPETQPLPAAVSAVWQAAAGEVGPGARVRVQGASGMWICLHGARLDDAAQPRVAVVVEPAGSVEIAPLIAAAYGLSERERSVAVAVARGKTTDEIARELIVSPWTVQDHLKAIFKKTGTGSRAQLVARLFFEQYLPFVEQRKHEDPRTLG